MIRLPSAPQGSEPQPAGQITLESLRDKFSLPGFTVIEDTVRQYETSIEDILTPDTTQASSVTEVAQSPFILCGEDWRQECQALHVDAERSLDKIKNDAKRVVRDEFAACGIYLPAEGGEIPEALAEAVQVFERAVQQLQNSGTAISSELNTMRSRYLWLVDSFLGDPLLPEDISARMQEKLQQKLAKFALHDTAPPQPPRWQIFKRADYTDQAKKQAGYLRSRLGNEALPTPQHVLDDYFKSVRGAHMRSVYGYRPMVLDRGFESDDTSQIDSFQREHYDAFGGEYLIALTPSEWAERASRTSLNAILYSDDSPVSAFLDAAVDKMSTNKEDYWPKAAGTRRTTRKQAAAGYQSTHMPGSSSQEADRLYSRGSEFNDVAPKTFNNDREQSVYDDMLLVFDARLPHDATTDLRDRINGVCEQLIKQRPGFIATYKPGDKLSRHTMLTKLRVATHPDRTSDGVICAILTDLQNRLREEEQAAQGSFA